MEGFLSTKYLNIKKAEQTQLLFFKIILLQVIFLSIVAHHEVGNYTKDKWPTNH